MRFDTKIAVAIRSDLADWQKLNVTAFLASGIAHSSATIMGVPYADGSGNGYLPMFREPVLVFAADAAQLTALHARALTRGLAMAVYTDELFVTDNDDDNRAAVAGVPSEKLSLAGVAVYSPRNAVDRTTKGLRLHG
ncbi:DUF2000 domain-containing protein [Actinopolymorpha alba]|uniref:DUF2000 domain-containing protein n=1 Tax=Actinopolymorpha alba TaxID=533267 RepID=UPI00035F9663|nr:DUF2000 domain-containing protein [Actinopolymorpha alba]